MQISNHYTLYTKKKTKKKNCFVFEASLPLLDSPCSTFLIKGPSTLNLYSLIK